MKNNPTFSVELVAPAIASLDPWQLGKLIDNGKAGEWLKKMTYLHSDPLSVAPDSLQAAELAGAAGDAEWEATKVMEELTEDQLHDLIYQARQSIDSDGVIELQQLMPIG